MKECFFASKKSLWSHQGACEMSANPKRGGNQESFVFASIDSKNMELTA